MGKGMWNVMRVLAVVLMVAMIAACARRGQTGVTSEPLPELPPPAVSDKPAAPTPPAPLPPTQRVDDAVPVTPVDDDDILSRTLDDLNRESPLRPIFFGLDRAELDDEGRAIASANADIMRKYPSWVITIEGHCDERGTAEYNLALGERRAQAVRTYLLSLGIAQDRVRTISYGKEFPFDPGHDEAAWAKNRRAHFVITSK